VTEQRLIHFLLVEDDDAHAEITIRSLKQNRVANKVDRVVDGAEALAYLRDPDRPLPDVILLDLNLPKVDGHEVLAAVKEDHLLCAIPIVVLTTSDAEVDRLKAYRHHANSYLVKPIDFNRFRQMVVELSLYWGVWNQPPSDVHSVNRNGERR
jgi:CheY-like chemotaxis protein